MPLTDGNDSAARAIDGYGPGFFRVQGQVQRGGILIHADALQHWGGYEDLAPILALADRLDVLFIGTGADIAHPPRAFRLALEAVGLMIEPMATPVAARSYNVLLSEGRRIGAALLPLPEARNA